MVRIKANEAEPGPKVVARKREILRAAARVFRAKGVTGARMKDIADELGAAVGNLYYYFRDKADLLAFCQEDGLAGLLDLTTRVSALDLGPAERLALLIAGHVVQVNESTPGALAHLEVEGASAERRAALHSGRARYEDVLRSVIEDGRARAIFRPEVDAKLATLAILGAVNWTVRWYDPSGGKSVRTIGREFAEVLVRGLLVPGVPFRLPQEAP
ncbi:MAG: TetR/AcrR family transcriptional regulator [Thermoanaerobaculia bacterium]|nr:TetR/AcrR family transcriptional regulator [Thermoanaerobaculia bacterium]